MKRRSFLAALGLVPLLPVAAKAAAALPASAPELIIDGSISAVTGKLTAGTITAGKLAERTITADRITPGRITADRIASAQITVENLRISDPMSVQASPEFYKRLAADPSVHTSRLASPPNPKEPEQ